jgi:hypothetical protein
MDIMLSFINGVKIMQITRTVETTYALCVYGDNHEAGGYVINARSIRPRYVDHTIKDNREQPRNPLNILPAIVRF